MILFFITFISFIQILLYYSIEKYKFKFPKTLILVFALIGYYFVFPEYFIPKQRVVGINCGMPTMAILLAFWFFGTIAGLVTHIIWIIRLQMKYKNTLFDRSKKK